MSYCGHTPAHWPIPTTVWSFAPDRVAEHPDIVLGAYISEPFLGAYISEPFLGQPPPAPLPPPDPEDVRAEHLLQAMLKRRGYTAIPSRDLREYVKLQIMTAGVGFVAGVALGAVLGPAALTFARTVFGR